jgi:hypothetical protein
MTILILIIIPKLVTGICNQQGTFDITSNYFNVSYNHYHYISQSPNYEYLSQLFQTAYQHMTKNNMSTLFDSLPLSSSFSFSSLSLLSLSAVTSISTDLLVDSIRMYDHILRECHKNTKKDASLNFLKKLADELADIFTFISIEILGMIYTSNYYYL